MPVKMKHIFEVTESDKHRFLSLVDIEDESECWEWRGNRNRKDYGIFNMDDSNWGAHRISWFIHFGDELNKGLYVLHRCDNPPCVNPNHIFLGTCLDNHRDMIAKGRDSLNQERRSRTHCAKGHEFTEENTGEHYGRRCCLECRRLYQASDQRRLRKQEVRAMKKAGTWSEDKMIRKTRKAGFKIC